MIHITLLIVSQLSINGEQLISPLSVKCIHFLCIILSKRAFNCSKLTIETLEQGAKYVQSQQ